MATISAAPILPVEGVTGVIYNGEFIVMLQQALVARGYDIGPAGIDGKYGPATAAALKAFQDSNPAVKAADQIPGYIGYQVAGCATYQALGLPVAAGYCRGGVTAPGSVCNQVMAAESRGEISLSCGSGDVPGDSFLPPSRDLWEKIKPFVPFFAGALIVGVVLTAMRR